MLDHPSTYLRSRWKHATAEATSIAALATTRPTTPTGSSPKTSDPPNTVSVNRRKAYSATLVLTPASRVLTADGASPYAPGSQECSGNTAILTLSPTTTNATAAVSARFP